MHSTAHAFKDNATDALANAQLQKALTNVERGFIKKRAAAKDKLPEFDQLRAHAKAIKDHTLEHLDMYLEEFERKVTGAGGVVHWAEDAAAANAIIAGICKATGARTVTKGKSMVAEEIGLNAYLEAQGIEPIETDLGEYIIQLRKEMPSHIVAPALHLNKEQIEADFRATHKDLPAGRRLAEAGELVGEARAVLRERFLAADVGITGANFLIAETGSTVIVTNEGNGDLTQNLPRVHVVIASIEKIVPTLEDAATIIRVLARSATGQDITTYTTFSTGNKRLGDPDGPEQYHVVILDNGRSEVLGSELREVLRCIRCGACMNHCPVYHAIGGHAYGWVYPGPIGAVLTPALLGVDEGGHLPNASTFCGRCEEVCPMSIQLPKLMRHWREREFATSVKPGWQRALVRAWAWGARRPSLYHFGARLAMPILKARAKGKGRFASLPMMGAWTRHRDFPAPQGRTFQALWAERQAQRSRTLHQDSH